MSFQVLQKPTAEHRQQLAVLSKKVASSVTELIQTAEAMKGEETKPHTYMYASTYMICSYAAFEAKLQLVIPHLQPVKATEVSPST